MKPAVGGILVIGVGNELLGDEGAGVVTARRLATDAELPDRVDVKQGATAGIDLLFELEEYECAVIVDAADMDLPPGTVRRFTTEDIEHGRAGEIASLHQIDLARVIELAQTTGRLPDIRIVGIQPADITHGIGLSEQVQNAVPRAISEVRGAISELTE